MQLKGGCAPTPGEAAGKASRVELYGCKDCLAETRFPRYNDPAKLLETRNVSTYPMITCFSSPLLIFARNSVFVLVFSCLAHM